MIEYFDSNEKNNNCQVPNSSNHFLLRHYFRENLFHRLSLNRMMNVDRAKAMRLDSSYSVEVNGWLHVANVGHSPCLSIDFVDWQMRLR